ncbi:MAG: protease, partial [bacterium]
MAGTKTFWLFISLTASLCFAAPGSEAQISQGGLPKSFSFSMAPDDRGAIAVQPPSPESFREGPGKQAEPYRFAVNIPVDMGITNSGNWTTAPDGSTVWRLTIRAAGALAITLYFDDFKLPEGGSFFVYNPSRTRLLGAFTSDNNDPSHSFATELLTGDQLTLEYDRPAGDDHLPDLHISELSYAYRGVPDPYKITDDFGNSGKCEVNINCEEGNGWQIQKKGIARIAVKLGAASFWCSGSLVNNVRNDHKPYFLTAYHCGQGTNSVDRNKWIFYFHYETTGCPNPANEPFSKSMIGSHLVATSGLGDYLGSDFYLLLLNKEIPANYDLYFNGWSRQESPSAPGAGIHHPEGDIKKISAYTVSLQPDTWS